MIAFQAKLSGFPKLSDFKKVETKIAKKLAEDLKKKFKAGSDFNGSPWVPKKSPGQLLIDTGETFSSLQASGNTVQIAGKMIYHQDGTSRLPARPIIGVGSIQNTIAMTVAREELDKLLQ